MTERPRRSASFGAAVLSLSALCVVGGAIVRGAAQQTPPRTPPAGSGAGTAAQPAPQKPATDKTVEDTAAGIPVTSDLVRSTCGTCHASDSQQRMSRISYRRATPEGWELTIKRMMSLNGLQLDPAKGREIIKYLADHHGLAPDEAAPAAFEVERRLEDFKYTADKDTEELCTKCHSMGRVIAERRTKEEWSLLLAMHRGYYPLIDAQGFRRFGGRPTEPGPDGRPPDTRQPMDKAIDHLARAFPLTTADWAAWSATMRSPRLAGRWAVSGYEAGKGKVFGDVTIAAGPSPDTFTTTLRYTYARSGQTVARTGKAIVYTGYQWRGRSSPGAAPAAATGAAPAPSAATDDGSLREVLFVDRGWREMKGRWFTGAYDEIGLDVTLRRLDAGTVLLGAGATALASGGTRDLTIYGANLPAPLAAADIDLGPGLTVAKIVDAKPDVVSLQVTVAKDAAFGPRDIFVAGASLPAAFVVYDRIDAIKVRPQAGLSRVGGERMPKQLQPFEAVAYHRGADGKPGTADDVELGLVDASWSLEEYAATLNDDDLEFVGAIDPKTGLFTPNADGPNPRRSGNRNNVGDVWVVATVPATGADGQPKTLRARAHLLVAVPLFMNWTHQTGVSQ